MTALAAPTAPFSAGLTPGGAAAGRPVFTRVPAAGATGTAHRTPHSALRPVPASAAGRAGRSGSMTPHCGVGSAVSGAVPAGCGCRWRGAAGAVASPVPGRGVEGRSRRLRARAERVENGLTRRSYPTPRRLSGSCEVAPQMRGRASAAVGIAAPADAGLGTAFAWNARPHTIQRLRSMEIGSDITATLIAFSASSDRPVSAEFGGARKRRSAAGSAAGSAPVSVPRSAEFGTGLGGRFGAQFGTPGTGRSARFSARLAAGVVGTIRAVDSATIRKEA